MTIENLLILSLVCVDFLLLAEVFQTALSALSKFSFFGLKEHINTVPVEIPAQEELVNPRYDVQSFRDRISALQVSTDEDGLYDVPEMPINTVFTGAEIVTENFEKDIDRFVRR